jgi:enoyl-CoA hydratase
MTELTHLLLERDGPVAILSVNRPDKLNALSPEVLAELDRALDELEAPSETPLSVLVLTGAGERAFVAGADVAAMRSMSVAEAEAFSEAGHRVARRLERAPYAVIAAVNGYALGGGCELALCADFIVCSTRAKFGQPELKLGLIPGFGGTQRLSRRVGIAWARWLIFTGETIDAEHAREIGLVNEVVEPSRLLERARALSRSIADKAPLAIAAAKRVLRQGQDAELDAACKLETAAFAALFASDDGREGMAAFVEKRAPEFKGS